MTVETINNESEDSLKVINTMKADLVQVIKPDSEAIARIVKELVGSTSLREYGSKAGVSASTLSRIINGKTLKPLTIETMFNIVISSDGSIDEKEMYIRDLAKANGMLSKADYESLHIYTALQENIRKQISIGKKLIFTIIQAGLYERGVLNEQDDLNDLISFDEGNIPTVINRRQRYDYRFNIFHDKQKYKWLLWAYPDSEDNYLDEAINDYSDNDFNMFKLTSKIMEQLSPLFLTDAWDSTAYSQYKMTVCFVDRTLYRFFCDSMNRAKLNNRFSALLIDRSNYTVSEECLFSSKNFPNNKSLFDLPVIMHIPDEDEETDSSLLYYYTRKGDEE